MKKFLFYPGCSLQKNARPYLESILALQKPLNFKVEEIKDWNCCGATEYKSLHPLAALALQGRNLALAATMINESQTVTTPCSSCYLNLSNTEQLMRVDSNLATKINAALAAGGLSYTPGSVDIRHFLDVVINDIGLEAVQKLVIKPLTGLRVAAYYGCMIARPDPNRRYDSHEYPTALENLLGILGAEVIEFPMKTHCCGGHMTQISPKVAFGLIRQLIASASEWQADLLVTVCPMCQMNLDAYQSEMNRYFGTEYKIPILYFTQLLGLAFGIKAENLGIGKEFVDSRPTLNRMNKKLQAEIEPLPNPRKSGLQEK